MELMSNQVHQKPLYVNIISKSLSIILASAAIAAIAFAVYLFLTPEFVEVDENALLQLNHIHYGFGALIAGLLLAFVAKGIWQFKNCDLVPDYRQKLKLRRNYGQSISPV